MWLAGVGIVCIALGVFGLGYVWGWVRCRAWFKNEVRSIVNVTQQRSFFELGKDHE